MRRPSGTRSAPAGLGRPLERDFYRRPAIALARAVLGRVLVREHPDGAVAGRIVEVEAYRGARDAASHAYRGPTARNAVMFGEAGHAYVYFTYGMHHCLNFVAQEAAGAAAVLVRALEPVAGLDLMRRRRGVEDLVRLARGPGCVAQALALARADDGLDLVRSPLWVSDLPPDRGGHRIERGPRIGIRQATDLEWRFFLAGHPCVSGGPSFRGIARRQKRRTGRRAVEFPG